MDYLNDTIKCQLEHRTIRKFKNEPVPENIFNTLMEVARRTSTSTGAQASSIIRITDNNIKKELAKMCNQEFIGELPELLIFLVDNYRNYKIALEKGVEKPASMYMNHFFQSFTDACITAQNVVVAAESLGLGIVYLGCILNEVEKVNELLKLPNYTFPVVGLGIGYPDQDPGIKPRMDMSLRVFENEYKEFPNYLEAIKEYDDIMREYYISRDSNTKIDSFSTQVASRLSIVPTKRKKILKEIEKQGFDLGLDD